jgi:DNA-binding beta-propeller fold protein YncE
MGMAMSRDGKTLCVSGGRGRDVHAIDVATQEPARAFADVGVRPWGLALSGGGKKLYTANGVVIRKIPVGGSPWGVAIR